MSLTLTLPMPSNRANRKGSGHWRTVKRDHDAYLNAAVVRILQQSKSDQRALLASEPVVVTAIFYVWSVMDDDNCVARMKVPLDALKHAGVLKDDKRPWCRLSGIPEQVIDRKQQRIVLTLTPVREA